MNRKARLGAMDVLSKLKNSEGRIQGNIEGRLEQGDSFHGVVLANSRARMLLRRLRHAALPPQRGTHDDSLHECVVRMAVSRITVVAGHSAVNNTEILDLPRLLRSSTARAATPREYVDKPRQRRAALEAE